MTWTHTAVYVNLATFFFVVATFYQTTGHGWFIAELGWAPGFPLFLLMLGAGVASFALLFVFRYDVPSTLGWYYDQLCTFGEVYRKDIESLQNEIRELKAEISRMQRQQPVVIPTNGKPHRIPVRSSGRRVNV